ncbi:MAG: N,N-dimethylformamidase beta subunit family domain-containing protein, partial [Candidatus Saccharimonadales bacterium]
MAKHSVFGSADLPVTLTLGDDGPGSIVVGNIFYTTLGAPTYACSGAKLWLPPGVTVPAQVTIEARYDVADINVNNLDTPALRSVTLSTAGVTGWLLVSWPTFAVEPGKMVLISSSFSGGRQTYLYHAQGDDNAIPATDGSPLYRSERATAPYNSSYYQINGGSVQGTAATFTYGVDIIVDDATPIAAYGFNELSGTTAYDATANSHDLTLNSTSNLGVSRIGGGLHQIGGGAANQITNAAPWFTAPDRTLSFWARRGDNGTADSQTVYQLDTTSTDVVFGISVSDGTQTAFTAKVDGVAITITHPVQAAGNWNYYTLTYDGLAVRGYVDGLLVGEQSAVGALDPTDDQLYIYGGEYQQQVIDDLRLFDVALSDADIVATMADDIIPPDATPPATPSGVTVSNIYQQVTLHWTASTDNVAVQNYVIYRSTTSGFTPTPADQVGGPSGTDYSEAVGVDIYYYRIAARDEAGNESDSSPEVMITTTANPAIDYLYPSALGWVPGTEYTDGVATGMSVGTFFGVDRPVSITGVRYYAPAAVSGGEAYLYDDVTKAVLASVVGVELVVGWNTILFDTPYVSIYGVGYIGAVYMPGASVSYTALPNAFDGTRTQVGPVYSVAPLSGFYDYNQRVPTVATTSWYGVDIIASSADGPTNESFGADIVAENILSGSSSEGWSIGGAGDITNLGFARQFSSNIGDTVEFSCHGTGTIIDIYSIGAYGGIGWRKVSTIDNTPTQQPDPDIIPDSNGGVTCTNCSTTATWTIPDDALSGLFVGVYRNLSRSDASYLQFAVRDDARPVDVIVKFSETTWALAYNYYGTPSSPLTGKSVYGSGGPMGDIGTRAHVGSYHRPIVTRAGIPQTYWLACEAPLIRFVESNGLNVKYVASKDVDENPALLQTAKVVVSSGHDEYWSE